MKRVCLIGDSIRIGYEQTVHQRLTGRAEVWSPGENGGNSANVLQHLDVWVESRQPDIVHLNCGLHDLRRDFETGTLAVGLDEYRANVRQIMERVLATAATLIWATTTPVNERWHHENKDFDRFEADVLAYNEAALDIAEELSVPVNDLYALVMETGRNALLVRDGVHFTSEGYALLGNAVADVIERYLVSHRPSGGAESISAP